MSLSVREGNPCAVAQELHSTVIFVFSSTFWDPTKGLRKGISPQNIRIFSALRQGTIRHRRLQEVAIFRADRLDYPV